MDPLILISNIIHSMREFQKDNNVKKECITNAKYLYDNMKMYGFNVKTKAVFVISFNDEIGNFTFVSGHLVVVLDDETILEPSYDIYCLKNISYFDTLKDLNEMFNKDQIINFKKQFDFKKILNDHIDFKKYSEKINNDQFDELEETLYYNTQADYVENYIQNIT